MIFAISALASIISLIFSIHTYVEDNGSVALIILSVVQFLLVWKLSKTDNKIKALEEKDYNAEQNPEQQSKTIQPSTTEPDNEETKN